MLKVAKTQFYKVFSLSIILEAIIISLLPIKTNITKDFIWKIIGIATIYALVFGVIYPLIWNYSSLKAWANILISTSLLLPSMAGILYLINPILFIFLSVSNWLAIAVLTLIGHTIIYVSISRKENKKIVNELNSLIAK